MIYVCRMEIFNTEFLFKSDVFHVIVVIIISVWHFLVLDTKKLFFSFYFYLCVITDQQHTGIFRKYLQDQIIVNNVWN